MTEDLTPVAGRVFVGDVGGMGVKLITVKSVRKRRDGTASTATVTYETGEVRAEVSLRMPKDGKMHGYRRVTLAGKFYGTLSQVCEAKGRDIPTDAFVIVTRDRVTNPADPLNSSSSVKET